MKQNSREIFILSDQGRERFASEYATMHDVRQQLGLGRSAAYEYMARLRRYLVHDGRRTYYAVERRFVGALPRYPAGNPNFKSRSYQRELAHRPRRGRA